MENYYLIVNPFNGDSELIYDEWRNFANEKVIGKDVINIRFDSFDEAKEYKDINFVGKTNYTKETSLDKVQKEIENRINSLTNSEAIAFVNGSYNEEKYPNAVSYAFHVFYKENNKKSDIEISHKSSDADALKQTHISGEIIAVKKVIKWAKEHHIKKLTIFHDYLEVSGWAYGYEANTYLSKEYKKQLEENRKELNIVANRVPNNLKWNKETKELAKKEVGIEKEDRRLF